VRVHTGEIRLATAGCDDILDITGRVERIVADSGIRTGLVGIASPGSTAGITTVEFEPGAVADLARALDRLAPRDGKYGHDAAWGDGNGFAHLRSALVGTSLTLAVREGRPALGTWQQVVFLEFDNRGRQRELVVTVVGE
jgi:secondary thiamine-phosphate synthase enzyme